MRYRRGFKIMVEDDFSYESEIKPEDSIQYFRHGHCYITLYRSGVITVHAGYASDLASGPTFNTKSSRRGAVVHDSFYELMRQGLLDISWRKDADNALIDIIKQDGMYSWRAWLWYKGLQLAGGKSALPKNKKKVFEAP